MRLISGDLIGVSVGCEHSGRGATIKPDLLGDRQEVVRREHRLCQFEIVMEQRLDELLPATLLRCPKEQSVRISGVATDAVEESEVEPFDSCYRSDVAHHLLGFRRTHSVLTADDINRAYAIRGRTRIKLKGTVDNLGIAHTSLLQGRLQPALADEAPRTHNVGPDLDKHHLPPRSA